MLVKVFKAGISNGDSPVNYLLSDRDHTGAKRSVKPEVFRGDPKLTRDIIDNIQNRQKYTSGVLSFRKNEVPSREEMHRIIDKFEDYMFGGLRDGRVNALWIFHMDKWRPELHFLVAKEDLKTGKALNISPPGKQNQDFYRLFGAMINDEFGYEQVSEKKKWILKISEYKSETDRSLFKRKIGAAIQNNYEAGAFKDRTDLVDWLTKNSFQVTKLGDDFITIRYNDKSVRLYGEIYKPFPDVSPKPPYVFNQFERNRLEHYKQARSEFFNERYNKPKRTYAQKSTVADSKNRPSFKAKSAESQSQFKTIAQRIEERVAPQKLAIPAPTASSTDASESSNTSASSSIATGQANNTSTSKDSPTSSPGGSGSASAPSHASQKVALGLRKSELIGKLANEVDPGRITELRNQLEQVMRSIADLEHQEMMQAGRELDRIYQLNAKSPLPK